MAFPTTLNLIQVTASSEITNTYSFYNYQSTILVGDCTSGNIFSEIVTTKIGRRFASPPITSTMKACNPIRKKCFYDRWRYWYHLSTNHNRKSIRMVPWDKDTNRCPTEPPGKRICVAPSIEQCLTAVPYCDGSNFVIYRTLTRLKATKPRRIFDSSVTQEGWLQKPTVFIRVGRLSVNDVNAKDEEMQFIIEEAATSNYVSRSRKVLKWWKQQRIRKYLK